ncbi:MAG: hypothetical protein LBH32_13805 [Dysgonamonadaceae bacterium]|jgi:hypothetical protein|nr:hypothetical protein [Dysgonamonadaceae bacterium]
MRGDIFAEISAVLIYGAAYLGILYCLWFLFSKGFKHRFINERSKSVAALVSLAIIFLLVPFLSGILFRIGVIIEESNGRSRAWGCNVEYVLIFCYVGAIQSFYLLIVTSIIALIKPQWFKFRKRLNILPIFILLNIFAFVLPILMEIVIRNMLAFVSGINSTCW